jgi:hypothetical protein
LAQIAIDAGFHFGAQLPDTVYHPLYFADQDWRNPDRAAYIAALAEHRPRLATVLDWEHDEQLDEVLGWAEDAAPHVEKVLIVPKVIGGIERLPRHIAGRPVVLAYSVPTKYAGTQVPVWEFAGWPVHLLGGSPHSQMQLWAQLTPIAEVVSVDGNMTSKMALQHCAFWVPGTAHYYRHINRWWPSLNAADGEPWPGENAHHEAFRRSCENVAAAWRRLTGG